MNELITVASEVQAVPDSAFNEDLFNRFSAYIDRKPKTIETYRKAIGRFFSYLQVNKITKPTRADVLAFRDSLKQPCIVEVKDASGRVIRQRQLPNGHKPTTIQDYIMAIRALFNWLETEGLYPNIASHVVGAKLDRENKKIHFTSSQIKAILSQVDKNKAQGVRDYAILALMVTCGLRTIEVVRANVEDLKTIGDSVVLYVQGKGHDERAEFVKVPEQVFKAILSYFSSIGGKPADDKPLFQSLSKRNLNERLTTASISRIAKQAFRKAGYDSDMWTAHSLRHTAVTLALLGGQSIQEAQLFARHADISTTTRYAHNLEREANKCSQVVASSIF